MRAPVDGVPVEVTSSGPFTVEGRRRGSERVSRHRCPTCPSVPVHRHRVVQRLTWPTSAPFRARAPGPVSGQLSGTTGGGAGHAVPVSCCLSATGIRFLGILFPPRSSALPHGRPTRHQLPGPDGVSTFHTRRDTAGVGAPCTPGTAVLTRPVQIPPAVACRFPAASPCHPGVTSHLRRCRMTRHHRGFTHVHPSGLPLACDPRMERGPLGFSLSFAPRSYPRRTSGRGRAIEHWPGATSPTSVGPPIDVAHSQRATSCRTIGLDMSVEHGWTVVLLGQGRTRAPCSPAASAAGPAPAKATPTSKLRSPRSPPAPRRPTPSSANVTDG